MEYDPIIQKINFREIAIYQTSCNTDPLIGQASIKSVHLTQIARIYPIIWFSAPDIGGFSLDWCFSGLIIWSKGQNYPTFVPMNQTSLSFSASLSCPCYPLFGSHRQRLIFLGSLSLLLSNLKIDDSLLQGWLNLLIPEYH